MGNCFISKPQKKAVQYIVKDPDIDVMIPPRKNSKEDTDSPSKPINMFILKQRDKVDTFTVKDRETQQDRPLEEKKKSIFFQQSPSVLRNDEVKNRKDGRNKLLQVSVQEDEVIVENVKKLDKSKGPIDYQLILNALSQHYFFSQISAQHKEDIVMKMFYCFVPAGDYVFKQGDKATSYFILENGSCQVIIDENVKKTIVNGAAFGELALLYNAPRSASIKADEDSYFWAIDRLRFRNAVEELSQKDYTENRKFIDSIKFFDVMTNEQKDAIAGVIITQQFKKDQSIVNEGDQASSYFIIKSGIVSITKGTTELRKMSTGDSFGEQALYANSTRGASAIAKSDIVVCLALGRDTLTKILGDKIQVKHHFIGRWAFQKHQILQKLTQIQIEKIVSKIETKLFLKGEIIFEKQQKCNKLAIVIEGGLYQTDLEIAGKGGMYGDQYLNDENSAQQIQNDIIMKEEGRLAIITYDIFYDCIGGQLEQIIKKNENSHENKYMKNTQKKQNYDHLKLPDMTMIKKLGFGQFGSVYLVKNKIDKKLYALKCIQKNQIVEQSLEKHLLQEKRVLENVQFPLIMQFIRPLKDENNIYFLVEYVKGMELFDVIRDIGLLNTYDSQFYIGSLVLCMEYLHSNSIIYRDIKPENIMVDHLGYMKLIDMGTAKFLKGRGGRTYTIIGTPHYMAPEIITGKGYTYSVDIWSIGICLYEFMCGGVPFAEEAEDPYEIYEEIVKKTLDYPSFLKDRKAKKLMDQMLNKTPEIRVGGSYAALKANQWFDHFDWDKLMDRELKPPYVPPKEKVINESEISKQEQIGKNIIEEIKAEQGNNVYNKMKAKDPLWDKEF